MSLDSCEVHIELSLDASWNQSFEKALPDRFTKVSLNASTREQVLDDLVDSGASQFCAEERVFAWSSL